MSNASAEKSDPLTTLECSGAPAPLSAAVLKSALGLLTEAVVVIEDGLSPDGPSIVFANDAMSRMTGYSAEELLGKNSRIFIGPHTDCATLTRLRNALVEKRSFHGNLTKYRKDGSTFLVDVSVTPWTDPDTGRDFYIATHREIANPDSWDRSAVEKRLTAPHLYDSFAEGAAVFSLDGTLHGVSPAIRAMLGYEPEELQEIGAFARVHPDDVDRVLSELSALTRSENKVSIISARVKQKTGSYVTLECVTRYVPNSAVGNVFVGSFSIAERRRRVEDVLFHIAKVATGEDFLVSLVEYLGISLKVEFACIAEIVGHDRQRLAPTACWGRGSLQPNFEMDLKGSPCEETVANGLSVHGHGLSQRYPDFRIPGQRKDVEIESHVGVALRGSDGEPIGVLAVFDAHPINDSTQVLGLLQTFANRAAVEVERRLAERRLRASEERFAKVFRASHSGIAILTYASQSFIDVNDRLLSMLGYQRDEVIGQTLDALGVWERESDRTRVFRVLREKRSLRDVEIRIRARQGAEMDVLASFEILGLHGEACVLAKFHDMTERNLLEKHILEASDRERRRIGRDLHDGLGQLLTGISLFSGFLEKKLSQQSSPQAKDASRIVEMVNEAVNQARQLAHSLCPVELEASGLVTGLKELAARVEKERRISCRCQGEDHLTVKDALVANQLYRIADEAIHLAIDHAKPQTIFLSVERRQQQLVIRIVDDGVGSDLAGNDNASIAERMIQYRARVIGATVEFQRTSHAGALFTCSVANAE